MLISCRFTHAANNIVATGGGVVEQGKDLVLNYMIDEANKNWSMCKWGRYQPSALTTGYTEFCIFTDFA